MGVFTKGIAGKEDIQFKSSGTTKQTFTRTDASSRTLTLDQIDGAHIQFRTLAKSIDDLVDGGYDVAIKPQYIFGGGANTVGHTVPDAVDDTFVLRDTDETISGDKTLSGANTHSGANTFSGVTTFTGTQKGDMGADVASEATLFDANGFPTDGNYFNITGTTGITSITTSGQVGTVIKLHFNAVLTITHETNDLVLPGGKNITTYVGLELEFTEYSASDWRLTSSSAPLIMPPGNSSGLTNWPSFSAYMSGQTNVTGIDQVEFDNELFDTNNNFDTGTYRFTPTVAGKYLLTVQVFWNSVISEDVLILYIYKNGVNAKNNSIRSVITSGTQQMTVVVDANGSSDYFEVFAQNSNRDTSALAATAGDGEQAWFDGSRIA